MNLLSGVLSIICVLWLNSIQWAIALIILAAVFDFFDGLAARALHVSSPIGKDLDSLADVVSFGVAPSILLFYVLQLSGNLYLALPSLLIGVFAALRLAKFNNDTRQTTSFIGLPVPSNALFWIGLSSMLYQHPFALSPYFLFPVMYIFILLFCFFMISEIPMFSFKIHGLGFKGNESRYALIILSVISIGVFHIGGFAPAVLLYILLSVIGEKKN